MADLRTRFASLDQAVVPDLWPEIERRALEGATSAGPSRVAGVSPTWRGAEPDFGAAGSRRLVLVLVLIGLLVVTLLGAALVGGLLHDPLRGHVRPAEADAIAVLEASPEPEATGHVEALRDGVTALPACPDGPVEPIEGGPLPDLGPQITATRRASKSDPLLDIGSQRLPCHLLAENRP